MKQETASKLWKVINYVGNAIALNLLFLVACLPVVTIGPAICGLYSAIRFTIRGDGWFSGFKEGYRKNFLRTAIAGSVCIALLVDMLLKFNAALNFYMDGNPITPLIVYSIGLILPLLVFVALWPLNVYIPYDTTNWLKKSFKLILKAPGPVLLTAVLLAIPVVLVLYFPVWAFLLLLIFVTCYFAVALFASTLFLKDALVILLTEYKAEHPEEYQTEETQETDDGEDTE